MSSPEQSPRWILSARYQPRKVDGAREPTGTPGGELKKAKVAIGLPVCTAPPALIDKDLSRRGAPDRTPIHQCLSSKKRNTQVENANTLER